VTIVAGFRRDGSGSVYFDAEPVYQFNSAGHLRRGFAAGKMFKASKAGWRRSRGTAPAAWCNWCGTT